MFAPLPTSRMAKKAAFWVLLASGAQVLASTCFDLAGEVARAAAAGPMPRGPAFGLASVELVSTHASEAVASLRCALRLSCLREASEAMALTAEASPARRADDVHFGEELAAQAEPDVPAAQAEPDLPAAQEEPDLPPVQAEPAAEEEFDLPPAPEKVAKSAPTPATAAGSPNVTDAWFAAPIEISVPSAMPKVPKPAPACPPPPLPDVAPASPDVARWEPEGSGTLSVSLTLVSEMTRELLSMGEEK